MRYDLMVVTRHVERFETDGGWRTRNLSTTYRINGRDLSQAEAHAWVWGHDPIIPEPVVEPEPTLEPGPHEIAYEDLPLAPVWHLLPGYPLGVATTQLQITADTTGKAEYIRNTDGRCYVVVPDPNSAHRDPNYQGPT